MTLAWSLDEGSRSVRAAVLLAVLALHVFFFRVLGYPLQRASGVSSTTTELRIEFIEAERPLKPVAQTPPAAEPTVPTRTETTRVTTNEPRKERSDEAPAPTPRDDAPLVMDWKQSDDAELSYRMNLPDTAIPDALAVAEPGRIRMRRKVTGEDVVEGVSKVLGFWPPGYESDPCPRVQRNISALMTDASADGREQLSEQLRRRKDACRG